MCNHVFPEESELSGHKQVVHGILCIMGEKDKNTSGNTKTVIETEKSHDSEDETNYEF